ncbi:NAD(P)/FAD-dependent oxidoreductase [Porticoccus sp.]|uniref:NAD(P)/FAD-dependent oxidoreductase n=1 Tax=Porticoccus sp. TaxID=2024853 RepID=UPI003F699E99
MIPAATGLPRLAIIGAGLSGLTLADELDGAAEVTVFDKSPRVGGRIATRAMEGFQFDYGAQFLTARSAAFQNYLKPLMAAGQVVEWRPRVITLGGDRKPYRRDWFEPHYVAVPGMNTLCQLAAEGKNLVLDTAIESLEKTPSGWFLRDRNDACHGPFDWAVCTVPAPQAAAFLPSSFSGYGQVANTVMLGCYSLLLGFAEPLDMLWQAAVVKNSPIGWLAFEPSRPGRADNGGLLVQSSNVWAEQHLEDDSREVQRVLWQELERLVAKTLPEPQYSRLHRWRYANTVVPTPTKVLSETSPEVECLVDPGLQLGVCGDWLRGGRVESAYLSGLALAAELKQQF